MIELLTSGGTPALKAYLRSIPGNVIVSDKTVTIMGSKDVLASAVTGPNSARSNVRGFVPKWRARRDSNS